MKPTNQIVWVLLLSTFLLAFASATEHELMPPEQDYYLHFYQSPTGMNGRTEIGNTNTFAWVLWEGSDFEEFQAATGIDMDQMTLLCGQRAYGFQYRYDDGVE